ncbi:MAG: KH domain-containing protein [Acidobacteriota bacterium]|nr:KH domain-containing protein [Acidobacteriota bacterium]
MRDLLFDVVSLLVDEPNKVEISERDEGGQSTFEVRVADDDLGKVIGRQGRTARALRRFLDVRGQGHDGPGLKILD